MFFYGCHMIQENQGSRESRVIHEAHSLINKELNNGFKGKLREIFISIYRKKSQGRQALKLTICLEGLWQREGV